MYKMLRKNDLGEIEVFYVDDIRVKKLYDIERKKERRLPLLEIREESKKQDLRNRQKLASDLRKIKIAKKQM